MISLEKLKILIPLQKLPKNVGDLGKLIVAPGFEKLPYMVTLIPSTVTKIWGRLFKTTDEPRPSPWTAASS